MLKIKFVVSTGALLKALYNISGAIDCRSVPILDSFLFEIKEGKMTVTAAGAKIYLSTELKVESNDNGSFAIHARTLLDNLKCMPEYPLIFKINKETFRVHIITEWGRYNLREVNAEKLKKVIRKRHPNAK